MRSAGRRDSRFLEFGRVAALRAPRHDKIVTSIGIYREKTVAHTSLETHATTSNDVERQATAHPVVRYNPDAPSEEWGWHGSWREFAPRGSNILIGLGVILMLLQNFTVHESRVETFYYNGIALIGLFYLVHRIRSGRKLRRAGAQK